MNGWILYDSSCGFCARWVPFWAPTLRARGYEIAPLASAWVREHPALRTSDLGRDIHLLRPDGGVVRGADVYRDVLRRIWWAAPIYLLSIAPGLDRIFDRAYRAFADNRFAVSRVCGLG